MHINMELDDVATLIGGRLVPGQGVKQTDTVAGTCPIENYVYLKLRFTPEILLDEGLTKTVLYIQQKINNIA